MPQIPMTSNIYQTSVTPYLHTHVLALAPYAAFKALYTLIVEDESVFLAEEFHKCEARKQNRVYLTNK